MIVESPAIVIRKLAVPFKEILMHSCGVVLYMIDYIIGLKCTIFTIFYFKNLCHTVELSYDDSNWIATR
jgi:hypothetical protein